MTQKTMDEIELQMQLEREEDGIVLPEDDEDMGKEDDNVLSEDVQNYDF